MKNSVTLNGRTVVAISGKNAVVLAMRWPEDEFDGLLGFAIRRTNTDQTTSWLQTALRFADQPVEKGKLHPSNEAPIKSFIWNDFGLDDDRSAPGLAAGSRFTYEVIPVRGTPPADLLLQEDASVRIVVSTEPAHEEGADEPEVHFNRGLSDMQEYERLFGEGHEPDGDPAALKWLARGLDGVLLDFVNEAVNDTSLRMDIAAYHLDYQPLIDAICKLGARCRISLDWGKEEVTTPPNKGPNGPAYRQLTEAGVTVHQRLNINISHNKYMVLKQADGTPLAVLTGSTNFTGGGIATQSNQSVIVRNPALAQAYIADFEKVLQNDNTGLHQANKQGATVDSTLQVFFSPHNASDRPDLDQLTALAKAARSSRLFMTFRMTDPAVINAMLDPSLPAFGVVDRVYQGKPAEGDSGDKPGKGEGGDQLIFAEAYTDDPRVVACNAPLDDEPSEDALMRELKRQGYDPLIHHKILLLDWDQPNCVVVTGSANYSANSTAHNDENSLIVSGDQRLAEEYFVEFCRLFTHWRPRWLRERKPHGAHPPEHLLGDSSWTKSWAPGGRLAEFLALATGIQPSGDLHQPATKTPSTTAAFASTRPANVKSLAGERIQHIVVLMMENRSFDHMLGLLPGVNGVKLDAGAAFANYLDPQNPDPSQMFPVEKAQFFGIPEGDIPPPTDDNGKITDLYGGPAHSFPAATQQQFNDKWGSGGRGAKGATPGSNNGFVKTYNAELQRTYDAWAKKDPKFQKPAQPPREHVAVVMSAFTPDQIPVISGLAQEFCVCDQWFSEVPGPTEPNRLFVHAATSVGLVHNPWEFPVEARTLYEDIDEHGGKNWAFYFHDIADSNNFPVLKKQTDKVRLFDRFYSDLQQPATFPNYVFLCPRYANAEDGFANSQHAPYDVRYGEHWIADVYEALRRSAIWENTLLIITYDEHGGFYDHVTPPGQHVLPPDSLTSPTDYDKKNYGYMYDDKGRAKPEYRFRFDRLGFRVPTVLVSPWVGKGKIESRQLQHTSVLATVRKIWGLRDQPLSAREGQAATFDDLFEELSAPRDDCPPTLTRPPLPDTSLQEALDQPLSPVQKEVFVLVNHLDGHEHSGMAAPMPKTQGEASQYIAERVQAHQVFHEAQRGRYAIYQDKRGKYRWRLFDETGRIRGFSRKSFASESLAQQDIGEFRQTSVKAK